MAACAELTGRHAECGVLDQVIGAVRSGESRALVLHGEAGVGKTALLDYLAGRAHDCQVTRVVGVQSEMELAFAGLHQLCAPALDLLGQLPAPQCEALRTVFGISAGPPPDMFLIGLAVLSLLSEAAERAATGVPGRRPAVARSVLGADPRVRGAPAGRRVRRADLRDARRRSRFSRACRSSRSTVCTTADARLLLDAVLTGPIDAQVRDQLVAEAHGNPLALLELPRGLTPAQLAGGFGLPGAGDIEESFVRRVTAMPDETRRLLVLAAADPSGDDALVRRAAARLGIGPEAAAPATDAGLAEFATRIRFRHPLVRSAAYRSASAVERRQVHQALAEVTDAEADPDRRAWHRAQAAAGPDEEVAAELERSAGRARARSGFAATAAFLQRVGRTDARPGEAGRPGAGGRAGRDAGRCLRLGRGSAGHGRGGAAHRAAARPGRARPRATRVRHQPWQRRAAADAQGGQAAGDHRRAAVAGDVPGCAVGGDLRRRPGDARWGRDRRGARGRRRAAACGRAPSDLLLDGTALYYRDGYAAGAQLLHKALAEFGTGLSVEEELQLLWMATTTSLRLWDADRWEQLSRRHVQLARETGVLSNVALALTSLAYVSCVRRGPDRRGDVDRRGPGGQRGDRRQARAVRPAGAGRLPRRSVRDPRTGRGDQTGRKPARRGDRDRVRRMGDRRPRQRSRPVPGRGRGGGPGPRGSPRRAVDDARAE